LLLLNIYSIPLPTQLEMLLILQKTKFLNILTSLISIRTTIILFGKKLWLQVVKDTDCYIRPSTKLICVAHTRKQSLNLMGSKRVNKDFAKSRVKAQKSKGTVQKKKKIFYGSEKVRQV